METYRSGHNEPHSKCGCPTGHVGSNPTVSAKKVCDRQVVDFLFKSNLNFRIRKRRFICGILSHIRVYGWFISRKVKHYIKIRVMK